MTFSAELKDTTVGPVTIWSTDEHVTRVEMRARPDSTRTPRNKWPSVLTRAVDQVSSYLRGERRAFDLPLELPETLTDFQKAVYSNLSNVEFGELTTYGTIAREIGSPGSARAVGQVVGANPISLVIPCHRVVGAKGRLTGFGSGVPNKVRLLNLEGVGTTGDSASSSVESIE